jgi:hypothetical protein
MVFVKVCLAALLLPQQATAANPHVHRFGPDGTLRFELAERTGHPHFHWPESLLNYQVQLDGRAFDPAVMQIANQAGESIPFQISNLIERDGAPHSMTLSFFSDLPTGAKRSFVFRPAASPHDPFPPAVRIREEEGTVVLDTGRLRVRLPGPQSANRSSVPGPVMQFDRGQGWIGSSEIISPDSKITAIKVTPVATGPLFAEYRVSYAFASGAMYEAGIKAIAGYDFIEFTERMEGFRKDDAAAFVMEWQGFSPDKRRGNEPIHQPRTLCFRGEDPAFTGPPKIENPAEDFYYWLGPYTGDGTICTRYSSFTDSAAAESLHIAILDSLQWNDREYSLWTSSQTLGIRFRHREGLLSWRFPLAPGSRKTALAFVCDKAAAAKCGGLELSYDRFIESRYGCMGLDRIKDWQLHYDGRHSQNPRLFGDWKGRAREHESAENYIKSLDECELQKVEGSSVHPVGLRIMNYWVVPGFDKWRDELSPQELERATAYLLFTAYIAAREETSPMRNGLGGHPNFMADWKYPLLAAAYLFPDHPLAAEWAAQFEKALELLAVFHTRPPVPAWGALGGRWTESIGIYNWAFIEPTTHANRMGIAFDGRNRWPGPQLAMHGGYLAGITTAPVMLENSAAWPPGTPLTPEKGFQRLHPPQGAHAGRRAIHPTMSEFGKWLLRYKPLVGEAMIWAARAPGQNPPQSAGTNPRLTSAKYTGYGVVLRAEVDTPDEISVFLQQIDRGPNYRWGFGNEGGCGDIYYYARGSSFSGHLGEDAGDRRVTDAELTSNTGVYRDQTFRAIGMNDLTEPLHNLGHAQFARILPRQGPDAYSWPEYKARSVMLAGADYIVTFDEVNNPSRMSWNIIGDSDVMPHIIPVRGEFAYKVVARTELKGRQSVTTRWDPYKGGGDRMAIISHRNDLKLITRKRGDSRPYEMISLPGREDMVFQHRDEIRYDSPTARFTGTAGMIRRHQNGQRDLALFTGSRIGTDGLTVETEAAELAVGISFSKPQELTGIVNGRTGGKLRLIFETPPPDSLKLFIGGEATPVSRRGSQLEAEIPSGEHRIQLCGCLPEPMPPQILRSIHSPATATIFFTTVASADRYRIETSRDGGETWSSAGESKSGEFRLGNLPPGKTHARVVALNATTASRPGKDFPIDLTGEPPLPPEGLRLRIGDEKVDARWGEILGAKEYVIYRRLRGETRWNEVFRGTDNSFSECIEGVTPPHRLPGLEAAASISANDPAIHEYAVAAADGHGEGPMSPPVSTDPACWLNWYPDTGIHYKRRSGYLVPPFVHEDASPPISYPE